MDFSKLEELTGGLRLRLLPLIKKDRDFKKFLTDVDVANKNNKPVFVALICCPDYSYKLSNDGWITYSHEKLGFGPGIMAVAYSKAVLELTQEVLRMNGKLKIVLFYGDTESKCKEILKKIHLNKERFEARVKCNISAGKLYYENLIFQYFPNQKDITLLSVGLDSTLYKKNIINISNEKIASINFKEIENIADQRQKVIRSLYGFDENVNNNLILEKARGQILDRIIVGTALSEERTNGSLYSLISLTPRCLLAYFNFMNEEKIPILKLGTN